ncbi:MAG: Fe-Mn family superoxide dismutase, partial [Bacteroidota bacterium]
LMLLMLLMLLIYLKYQNKRPDYINAFYNIINWKTAAERYEQAR